MGLQQILNIFVNPWFMVHGLWLGNVQMFLTVVTLSILSNLRNHELVDLNIRCGQAHCYLEGAESDCTIDRQKIVFFSTFSILKVDAIDATHSHPLIRLSRPLASLPDAQGLSYFA